MPQYHIRCATEGCDGPDKEVITSHSKAKEMKCEVCGGVMEIAPSSSAFRVHGFNAANGYHRETINYDGSGG